MSWKYNDSETDVFWGVGLPTNTVTKPTLYINAASGAMYTNLGGSTWSPSGSGQLAQVPTALAAATTLTAADSGKTFLLALAGGFTVTLPANTTIGFRCRFVVSVAPTTAYLIAAATADTIGGSVLSSSGGAEDTEAAFTADTVGFVANVAVPGDIIEIEILSATQIWARATCSAAGGCTFLG